MIGRCLGYQHAKADPDRSVLWSWLLLTKTSAVWKDEGFCTPAASVQRLGYHRCGVVTLSQPMLSLLLDNV